LFDDNTGFASGTVGGLISTSPRFSLGVVSTELIDELGFEISTLVDGTPPLRAAIIAAIVAAARCFEGLAGFEDDDVEDPLDETGSAG
jgi:hypothetical protein